VVFYVYSVHQLLVSLLYFPTSLPLGVGSMVGTSLFFQVKALHIQDKVKESGKLQEIIYTLKHTNKKLFLVSKAN